MFKKLLIKIKQNWTDRKKRNRYKQKLKKKIFAKTKLNKAKDFLSIPLLKTNIQKKIENKKINTKKGNYFVNNIYLKQQNSAINIYFYS